MEMINLEMRISYYFSEVDIVCSVHPGLKSPWWSVKFGQSINSAECWEYSSTYNVYISAIDFCVFFHGCGQCGSESSCGKHLIDSYLSHSTWSAISQKFLLFSERSDHLFWMKNNSVFSLHILYFIPSRRQVFCWVTTYVRTIFFLQIHIKMVFLNGYLWGNKSLIF